jgi:hypothetical protein
LIAYEELDVQDIPVYDGKNYFSMNINELKKIKEELLEYEYKDSEKERILKLIPKNFFKALGYEPLTLYSMYRLMR